MQMWLCSAMCPTYGAYQRRCAQSSGVGWVKAGGRTQRFGSTARGTNAHPARWVRAARLTHPTAAMVGDMQMWLCSAMCPTYGAYQRRCAQSSGVGWVKAGGRTQRFGSAWHQRPPCTMGPRCALDPSYGGYGRRYADVVVFGDVPPPYGAYHRRCAQSSGVGWVKAGGRTQRFGSTAPSPKQRRLGQGRRSDPTFRLRMARTPTLHDGSALRA